VKKLDIWKGFSDTIFAEEINCLMRASAKHHNVVRFLGYCADTHGEFVPFNRGYVMSEVPQRLLCFEYVPNGNLEKHLKGKACSFHFTFLRKTKCSTDLGTQIPAQDDLNPMMGLCIQVKLCFVPRGSDFISAIRCSLF
jgi:hypothetical protein